MHAAQVREKNDKFQQRTLESMFDGQRSAAAAANDAAADMDIEVRTAVSHQSGRACLSHPCFSQKRNLQRPVIAMGR